MSFLSKHCNSFTLFKKKTKKNQTKTNPTWESGEGRQWGCSGLSGVGISISFMFPPVAPQEPAHSLGAP